MKQVSDEYDLSYPPDEYSYIIGYGGLVANLLNYFEVTHIVPPMLYVISIAYRIVAAKIVYNCAGRQNRDQAINPLLAFVFPTIVLIVFGYLKKRRVAK